MTDKEQSGLIMMGKFSVESGERRATGMKRARKVAA